eukprot:jgi/Mesvir1/8404/Mv12645-RA.1
MPRTSTVPLTGTHVPVRLFASDEVGQLKVVESLAGVQPTVAAKRGGVNRPHAIQAFSLDSGPGGLLAVARADGVVELLDPVSLARRAYQPAHAPKPSAADKEGPAGRAPAPAPAPAGNAISAEQARQLTGVSLVRTAGAGAEAPAILVSCTKGGAARVCTPFVQAQERDAGGAAAAEGGGALSWRCKGLDVSLWDIERGVQTHTAKNVKPDHLGLVKPTWVTCLDFLDASSPLNLVAGTAHGEVRVYDFRAQRRPVHVATFGEGPVSAVRAAPGRAPGGTPLVLAGNGHGVISALDARAGFRPSSGFKGVTGAIRSISLHPTEPLVASVGLDRFLRVHDLRSRHLVSKVFLKQPLLVVEFDGDEARLPVPPPPAGAPQVAAGKDSKKRKAEAAAKGGKKHTPPPADEDEEDADGDGSQSGDSDGDSEVHTEQSSSELQTAEEPAASAM